MPTTQDEWLCCLPTKQKILRDIEITDLLLLLDLKRQNNPIEDFEFNKYFDIETKTESCNIRIIEFQHRILKFKFQYCTFYFKKSPIEIIKIYLLFIKRNLCVCVYVLPVVC